MSQCCRNLLTLLLLLWRLGASDLGDTELVESGSCTEEFMISFISLGQFIKDQLAEMPSK